LKFKIDENLPSEFAAILQGAGFEADTVADEDLSGAADALLAQHARTNQRVLITLDMDFANIQSYPPATHAGMVVLRSHSQDKMTLLALLQILIRALLKSFPEHRLWIVEHDRIRYRDSQQLATCHVAR
jgi:predicted nuclease of predicted toxin-antitoxin system